MKDIKLSEIGVDFKYTAALKKLTTTQADELPDFIAPTRPSKAGQHKHINLSDIEE